MNNFYGMQQLALVAWLQSGDVFPVFKRRNPTPVNPYSLRIHLVEADRVRTPAEYGGGTAVAHITDGKNPSNGNRIFDGVEVDNDGMVVAYYVHNTYPWQTTTEPTKWTRVEAYGPRTGLPNILHIMGSERPDQYRGRDLSGPGDRAAAAAAPGTRRARLWPPSSSLSYGVDHHQDQPDRDPHQRGRRRRHRRCSRGKSHREQPIRSDSEYEMGPGTVSHLAENEDIKFGNPSIPTTGFDAFVKTFCQQTGAALGEPYEVLMKTFNSSYSASRAALLEAWEEFKMRRSWFVADFCQPAYEVWLSEAVARGRIKAPGFFEDPLVRAAWCGARWIGPVQGQLDPLKEANAAVVLVDHGFKTHEQVTRELGGGDWEANVEQLKAENAKLAEAGGARITNLPSSGADDGDGGDGKGTGGNA